MTPLRTVRSRPRLVAVAGVFLAVAALAACLPAPPPGTSDSPSGSVDRVTIVNNNQVRVQGWTSDWNTRAPIQVAVRINGTWQKGLRTANVARPDVHRAFRRGANFGFDLTFPATRPDATTVCVAAVNVGPGENTMLGCARATPAPRRPTTTTTTTPPVPVAAELSSAAYDLDTGGGYLWAVLNESSQVARYSPSTGEIVYTTAVELPWRAAWTGTQLAVISRSGPVCLLNADTTLDRCDSRLGGSPFGVEYAAGSLWVSDDAWVFRLDPTTLAVTAMIPFSGGSTRAVAWDGSTLWVSSCLDNEVRGIDPATNTITVTVPAGTCPTELEMAGTSLWASNEHNNSISIIDTASATLVDTIEATGGYAMAYDGTSMWAARTDFPYTLNTFDTTTRNRTRTMSLPAIALSMTSADGAIWVSAGSSLLRIPLN